MKIALLFDGLSALGKAPEVQLLDSIESVESALLEFATEVDGKLVEGIDKLTFDDDGLIIELKVMIRPASALQAVGAKMAEQFKAVGLGLPQ